MFLRSLIQNHLQGVAYAQPGDARHEDLQRVNLRGEEVTEGGTFLAQKGAFIQRLLWEGTLKLCDSSSRIGANLSCLQACLFLHRLNDNIDAEEAVAAIISGQRLDLHCSHFAITIHHIEHE